MRWFILKFLGLKLLQNKLWGHMTKSYLIPSFPECLKLVRHIWWHKESLKSEKWNVPRGQERDRKSAEVSLEQVTAEKRSASCETAPPPSLRSRAKWRLSVVASGWIRVLRCLDLSQRSGDFTSQTSCQCPLLSRGFQAETKPCNYGVIRDSTETSFRGSVGSFLLVGVWLSLKETNKQNKKLSLANEDWKQRETAI